MKALKQVGMFWRVMVLLVVLLLITAAAPGQASGAASITQEDLAAWVGVALSLAFAYTPKLNEWYAKQDGMTKRQIMLVVGVVLCVGIFALGCAGVQIPNVPSVACEQASVTAFVNLLFSFAIANQAAFLLATPGGKS